MDQFPLGFNPLQPPPMFDPHYHHQYMQRVSPMNQGPVWPHCGRPQLGEHQGYQMPPAESCFAEFPALRAQQFPPVPNYVHEQVLQQDVERPHVSPVLPISQQNEEYYVRLNKSFLRTWARMESQRHIRFFDEEYFLKFAEWAENIYFEILHKLHFAIRTVNDAALAEVVRLVEDASVMTNELNQEYNELREAHCRQEQKTCQTTLNKLNNSTSLAARYCFPRAPVALCLLFLLEKTCFETLFPLFQTILRWDGRKFHVVSPTVLAPLDYGWVPNYPFPLYGTHSFPVPGPISYAVPNYGRRV
ncbi:hypothetical protein PRIPAC_96582 [Pristionchus pacificus]|uniref:Uncharacterized protein n=1 Tax=Pristionchus pacificus TaxID=54126 RepID=A0A2A6CHC0_PRIPA|nr:hypothetical protein PRIPAC_96582 [Pristionchus pacificus]|eukprot:PDM77421.1 hypothetical protein PRIPAC_33151 [Pristionchus pacificus]